jgi:RNA polymerase sigma-70 factor (ECF subfamily)
VSVDPKKGSPEQASPRRHLLQYAELASMADDVLMMHLQGGNNDALAVLFDRYHRLVLNVALRILRDRGEAEDLVQSVFLEIFRSAAQFDSAKGSTKVWLLQYAYHRGFNRRQYLNLRGIYVNPEDSGPTLKRPMALESRSLAALDSARAVQQALAYLNKVQRRTLELAFYEGLTMHEIAERTGESFDTVRHHYYRGLEKLRSTLCSASESRLKSPTSEQQVPHAQS